MKHRQETGSLGLSVLLCSAFCCGTRTPTQTLPHQGGGPPLEAQAVTIIMRQDTSAGRRGQQIALRSPSFRTRPSKKIALAISQKKIAQVRLRSHNVHVQALGIMPLWQLSGRRVRSSLAFHLNEASQSKFLPSTLSATRPPPLERQILPYCGPNS
jgi:hypothetical protein